MAASTNRNASTVPNSGLSPQGQLLFTKQIIASNNNKTEPELINYLLTGALSNPETNQAHSISEVWKLINHDGKNTGDSTATTYLTSLVNSDGSMRLMTLEKLLQALPIKYGKFLIDDLIALNIENLNNYDAVMNVTVPSLPDGDATIKDSFFAGVAPDNANGNTVLNRCVATGQVFGNLTNSPVGAVTGNAGSTQTVGYADSSNSAAKIWNLLGGFFTVATNPTDVSLAAVAVTSVVYNGGSTAMFGTKTLTRFGAFNQLVSASPMSSSTNIVSIYQTAKIPFEVLILSGIKEFVQTYYLVDGSPRPYNSIITLMRTASYTTSFAVKFPNLSDSLGALKTAGYTTDNITKSTWFTDLATPVNSAATATTAQTTIKAINSTYNNTWLSSATLAQRMSWFNTFFEAKDLISNANTCSLVQAMTMILTTDTSDAVYSSLKSNFVNGRKGFITQPAIFTDITKITSGFPTIVSGAISDSELFTFKTAFYFTTLSTSTYPLINIVSTVTSNFARLVSQTVIADLALGYKNNASGWLSEVAQDGTRTAPNNTVIFALTNKTILNIEVPANTTASEKTTLLKLITGPDYQTYLNSTLVLSEVETAYTANISADSLGDITLPALNTNVLAIWNTKGYNSSNVAQKTLYGAKPRLSLLAYIFGLSSASDKATLLNSVLMNVSSDSDIQAFFDLLIAAYTSSLTIAATAAAAALATATARATAANTAVTAANTAANIAAAATADAALATATAANTAATTAVSSNTAATATVSAIALLKSSMLSGAVFDQVKVAGLFNSAFNNTSNALLSTPAVTSIYNTEVLTNMGTAFRTTWFSGADNVGFADPDGGLNVSGTGTPALITSASFTDQASLLAAGEISFTNTVAKDVNILRCRTFYSNLNYNALYAAVVVNSTTVIPPGLWLKFINLKTFSNTKYPLSLLLSLTYNAQSFDYTTGVLSLTAIKQLITGKDAVEKLGYDKDLVDIVIRQFASFN
jgi:hypothetical protein